MSEFTNIVFNAFMYPFEKIALKKRRQALIAKVKGNVLEVGVGNGVNFEYYNIENIKSLTVTDLSFTKQIKQRDLNNKININYKIGNMENLPFEDNTFDSIVATLVFCSVDNQDNALSEIKRVLKPNGYLYFIEHVVPESIGYRKIANSCDSTWHKIGKCHINRETHKNIQNFKFEISYFEEFGKECFIFVKGIGKNIK
ncbi:MAG: class I SAM-dependent methyltransferase [Sarcina sp.]